MAPLRPRNHVLGSVVFMILLVAGLLWWLFGLQNEAEIKVQNEDEAHALLEALGDAQRAHMAAHGMYGWIPELRATGALPGVTVETEDGTTWIRTRGYRIDALLPPGRNGEGVVELALEGERRASGELRKRHFALVARPLEPRISGYRIYYLDERDEMYLSDLVSNERGSRGNALPRLHKASSEPSAADALIWVKESELVPR